MVISEHNRASEPRVAQVTNQPSDLADDVGRPRQADKINVFERSDPARGLVKAAVKFATRVDDRCFVP
ncbi:MAG: hypothetical protein WAS07_03035, partial [Micropruina sp.]